MRLSRRHLLGTGSFASAALGIGTVRITAAGARLFGAAGNRALGKTIAGAGVVAASGPPHPARAAGFEEVAAPIVALDDALVALMQSPPQTPFPQRFQTLGPQVDRAFDLPSILRISVGPRWATLAPSRQAALLAAFRQFTVASYVANYQSDGGERFAMLPPLRPLGDDQVVQTEVRPRTGSPVRIDYVMRRQADEARWQAVDILLDGSISRVAVQRSDFRALIAQGDGARLLDSLNRRVTALSKGTLVPADAG